MCKKAIVLHSGGLDSTVCLLMAIERGREVTSLGIDYGQRHSIELAYADAQCRALSVERRVISVRWTKPHRLLPSSRSVGEIAKGGVSPAFLPVRNIVFLALASAEATGLGAKEVWIGVNSREFSGYPDCTPEFISSFRTMIKIGAPESLKVVAPLQEMTKQEIASEAQRLGLAPGDTWSCYQPAFVANGVRPCGECDACVLHEHAWSGLSQSSTKGLLARTGL